MVQTLSEIRYKCNDCIHKDVCKYKEEYQKITSDIMNITIPEYFIININCKNYSNNITGIGGTYRDISPYDPPITLTNDK